MEWNHVCNFLSYCIKSQTQTTIALWLVKNKTAGSSAGKTVVPADKISGGLSYMVCNKGLLFLVGHEIGVL